MMGQIKIKRIILWGFCCIASLVIVYCLLRFVFSIDAFDRSGWNSKNGTVRYLDYFGRPKTQWQIIDGKYYYFNPKDGSMVTGWHVIDNEQYYFYENGVRAAGWLQKDGKQFYLNMNGTIVKGWLENDGKQYYLDSNGVMVTGWLHVDEKQFYFDASGSLTSGWQLLDGKNYYLTQDGSIPSGWVELDGVRYQFRTDGSAVTGWFEDPSGKYYFDESGCPYNGWLDFEQKRYYLKDNGSVYTGWLTQNQDRYYFYPDGRMAIGQVEIDGVARFFTSAGKEVILTNPWNPVPDDYVMDLVEIEGHQIDRKALESLQKMLDDCRTAGYSCVINNSYRSRAVQQWMWDDRIAKRMDEGMTRSEAVAFTSQSLAIPGRSEHQTGLAVDITGSQQMYDWLAEHCWDYGFILRYPENRFDVTGIIFEPWHFRYVGTELSLELKELGYCMEEYMTMLTEEQENIS